MIVGVWNMLSGLDEIWKHPTGDYPALIIITELTKNKQAQLLHFKINKANLRDLIAATGLVIVLKLDSDR